MRILEATTLANGFALLECARRVQDIRVFKCAVCSVCLFSESVQRGGFWRLRAMPDYTLTPESTREGPPSD